MIRHAVYSAVLVASMFFITPIRAEDALGNRILSVKAEAVVSVPAEKVQVTLGVVTEQITSASEAQSTVAVVSEKLVNFLKEQNVEGLQTQSLRLYPQTQHRKDAEPLTVYVGENMLSFRITPTEVGQIVDQAVRLGATRVDEITPYVDPKAYDEAKLKAIELAVKKANNKALAAIAPLSAKIKDIVRITVSPDNMHAPQPVMRMMAMDTAPVSAYEAGEQSVSAQVHLQLRYSR